MAPTAALTPFNYLGGKSFYQIGTDGGFLNSLVMLYELTLTPGERADIVIDFTKFARGENVVLANTAPPMLGDPGEESEKDIYDIMQFRVRGGRVNNDITLSLTDLYLFSDSPVMEISQTDAIDRDFKLEDVPDPDPNVDSK